MTRTYVLDANALLNFISAGPGFLKVESLLQEALEQQNSLSMSVLNWGEVFYTLWQQQGEQAAKRTIANLSRLPLEIVPVDLAQVFKAGELKAVHRIPYVDCIAAALATLRDAVLVTSDRDFEKLGRHFPILWIGRS
ncbi:MAG TPA: type II toxin-antitoxin system VapC family toxin [Terriglobales bacterium]|nr:type II toxin-antitoxin system VapC family toxin [Terriglobales bacterium]